MGTNSVRTPSPNPDPITGAPGAAAGTLAAGPVGTLVGAAVGAIAGGLGGKAVAEHYDPTIEDAHWKENYKAAPYYEEGMTYDDYAPAYRVGAEAAARDDGMSFEDAEDTIAGDYQNARGASKLEWTQARSASQAEMCRMMASRNVSSRRPSPKWSWQNGLGDKAADRR